MAVGSAGRALCRTIGFLQARPAFRNQQQDGCRSLRWKGSRIFALLGASTTGLLGLAGLAHADEAEHGLASPNYPWPHKGLFSSYDHASIRRGHQVFQQICAACHSMSLLAYRDLIGVAYTEDEVKAISAEVELLFDESFVSYEAIQRCKMDPMIRVRCTRGLESPATPFKSHMQTSQLARFANGGAYPPDLSLIAKARHNGQSYVFALLTGYREAPAGISVREGLHYNPYFPGGAIAMPKMLTDGGVEYEDGTPATESQMAKDVGSFLSWAAEPEMDERKLIGAKWIFVLTLVLFQAGYYKRWKWSPIKSRRLVFDVVN